MLPHENSDPLEGYEKKPMDIWIVAQHTVSRAYEKKTAQYTDTLGDSSNVKGASSGVPVL